jgi:hypothetical protein
MSRNFEGVERERNSLTDHFDNPSLGDLERGYG